MIIDEAIKQIGDVLTLRDVRSFCGHQGEIVKYYVNSEQHEFRECTHDNNIEGYCNTGTCPILQYFDKHEQVGESE
jgi:hypothetical protein